MKKQFDTADIEFISLLNYIMTTSPGDIITPPNKDDDTPIIGGSEE